MQKKKTLRLKIVISDYEFDYDFLMLRKLGIIKGWNGTML